MAGRRTEHRHLNSDGNVEYIPNPARTAFLSQIHWPAKHSASKTATRSLRAAPSNAWGYATALTPQRPLSAFSRLPVRGAAERPAAVPGGLQHGPAGSHRGVLRPPAQPAAGQGADQPAPGGRAAAHRQPAQLGGGAAAEVGRRGVLGGVGSGGGTGSQGRRAVTGSGWRAGHHHTAFLRMRALSGNWVCCRVGETPVGTDGRAVAAAGQC